MRIDRDERFERPTEPGFVGEVRVASYYRRASASRLVGGTVSFAPDAAMTCAVVQEEDAQRWHSARQRATTSIA